MDTILLCGGHMEDAFVLGCIKKISPDCIIGVDRGLEFCYRNRIVPQYILGDFDSIDPEVIRWYRSQEEIPIREYKPEKDATDTRMGLELAMELGSDRIFLLGATGGRLDHYMGNLQSLIVPAKCHKEAWILDEQNAVTVLWDSRTIKKRCAFGKYISFFSMGDEVRGITLSGFKYPLKDYNMTNFDGIGVSNELAEDTALVEFRQGYLLMVMSKDR